MSEKIIETSAGAIHVGKFTDMQDGDTYQAVTLGVGGTEVDLQLDQVLGLIQALANAAGVFSTTLSA